MISAEYEPASSHVDLNLSNEVIITYLQDGNEAGDALKEADPVKWLVGTVAIANKIAPSEVSDAQLMADVILGQDNMDPTVYGQTKRYLGGKGYRWISGCFG